MSLAQAINIDFWFSAGGPRPLSQAQFYQPGMMYQMVSWLVYRLTSPQIAESAHDLFRRICMNPDSFWLGIQFVALLLALSSIVLLWRRARDIKFLSLIAVLSVYFVCSSATRYGIFLFWNESFSLLLAILFFTYAAKLLKSNFVPTLMDICLCGLFAGFLYMHKLNYIVWGLAFIPALFAKCCLEDKRWSRFAIQVGVYFASIVLAVQGLGRLLLGNHGFSEMMGAHRGILMGSEIYGGGARTVFNLKMMLNDLFYFVHSDRYALVFFCIFTLLPIALLVKNRSNIDWLRKNLPELVLLLSALLVMGLALVKHFQTHYTVSIAAIFPLLLIWLYRAGMQKLIPLLIPLIVFAVHHNANTQVVYNQSCRESEKQSLADEVEILKMPMATGETRLWMYRAIVPSFQRLFAIDFAGLGSLQKDLNELQGEQWMITPWISTYANSKKKIADNSWRYIVVATQAITGKFLDPQIHSWLNDPLLKKTELRQLTVFENSK